MSGNKTVMVVLVQQILLIISVSWIIGNYVGEKLARQMVEQAVLTERQACEYRFNFREEVNNGKPYHEVFNGLFPNVRGSIGAN